MPHNLNVVLLEPEIPSNTGSIGRLCLATQSTLHLVEPLGFEITDSRLKRAGLDYWQYLNVVRHADWDAFLKTLPAGAPCVFFSKKAQRHYFEHRFAPGSYLIFGKETLGLPEDLIQQHAETAVRIPQYDDRVRSLNLSNAVSIAVYEAIRQLGV
ncbi:tRNA (cytidine(34)-2'-O)-methyltransferase [Nitrospina watsonii]|uniref:Putative tRNA (cytidine(34)-2'-O)-methyltransferase n=1 Tax=Nitrospina watsonii TaxID=1323948 RepID=A0ABM9HGG4_9BACT|nr:tRNA (cytidine(34)-2'-O)-methyltransferase [Nitrospina watsonii]CAI2719382.1 tRNA (cytidine(34)-2'-O)-methyltransferase [Nitrospina watsonii]